MDARKFLVVEKGSVKENVEGGNREMWRKNKMTNNNYCREESG